MGNERWILKQLRGSEKGLVELGAGDGKLTRKMAKNAPVVALDLQDKPEGPGLERVTWLAGDLFETLRETGGETVVANLILHHFENRQLGFLGKLLGEREKLIFVEPWRTRLSLVEGAILWPLVNRVTRHDMTVSIRAGFRRGELPGILNLGDEWQWREEVSLLGGLRVVAFRR